MTNLNDIVNEYVKSRNTETVKYTIDDFIKEYADNVTETVMNHQPLLAPDIPLHRAVTAYCLTNGIDTGSEDDVCLIASCEPNTLIVAVKGDIELKQIEVEYETVRVVIYGEGTLTINADHQQPCIGPRTHTGMSYGRWSSAAYPHNWETLDLHGKVHVILNSKVDNFSIGAYNHEEMPEINIEDYCTLDCPEVNQGPGRRIQTHKELPPQGSTKMFGYPVYKFLPEGKSLRYLMDPEIKELIADKPFAKCVEYSTPRRKVKQACELYEKYGNKINYIYFFHFINSSVYLPVAILQPESLHHSLHKFPPNITESNFELVTRKFDILDKFTPEHYNGFVAGWYGDFYTLITLILNKVVWTDWVIEYCYQLIPAYEFIFDNDLSHYENLVNYLKVCFENTDPEFKFCAKNLHAIDYFIKEHQLEDDIQNPDNDYSELRNILKKINERYDLQGEN